MQEICIAIERLTDTINQTMSMGEVASIWIPILLSLIAIWISLLTVRKQSKIDLFEKRYDVYCQIEKIISYKDIVKSIEHPPMRSIKGEEFDLANTYLSLWRSQDAEFDKKLNLNSIKDEFELIDKINVINMRKEMEIKILNKTELLYYLNQQENKLVFDFIEKYKKFIDEMIIAFFRINKSNIKSSREEFISACEKIEVSLLKKIRSVINVNNI